MTESNDCAISENGVVQLSADVGGDGSTLGSRRNVRVIHLRQMKKHPSVDNFLSYNSDL